MKVDLLASKTGNTPLSFPTYHSLEITDLIVTISNKMATAITTTCSTATTVLVAPPEDFEMPSLRGDLVPVRLGSNETSILHVHITVLVKSSEFLKNALKPEWRTDATKPIDISDVELTTFETYCGWLYTGKIVYHGEYHHSNYLAELYVLREKLMNTAFKDVIVAAIIRSSIDHNMCPGNRAIQTVYAGTPASSPARRLMVDFWVFGAKTTWKGLSDLIEKTCSDFVNDLIRELIVKRGKPSGVLQRPWVEDPDSYRVDS
ncbi:unnamed protein product [Alternaria alternata]